MTVSIGTFVRQSYSLKNDAEDYSKNTHTSLSGKPSNKDIDGLKGTSHNNGSNLPIIQSSSIIIRREVINFSQIKEFANEKIKGVVDDFLLYMRSSEIYGKENKNHLIQVQLGLIHLATHPNNKISKPTLDLLHSIQRAYPKNNHHISGMVNSILEEEPNFPIIKKFTQLIAEDDLKETIADFLILSASGKIGADSIKGVGESEEKRIKHIGANLLRFANDQNAESSKTILDFTSYLSKSTYWTNQDGLHIAAVIQSAASFMKLSIPQDFKNTFLAYLQADNAPEKDELEKLKENLTRFANASNSTVSTPICDFFAQLNKAGPWKKHWMSSLIKDVLEEKNDLPNIGAFKGFMIKSEEIKGKKDEMEKFAVRFSALLKKSQLSSEEYKHLRKSINYLMSRIYNAKEGKLNPIIGNLAIVINFFEDFVKLGRWNGQAANPAALNLAKMILALRDFLNIENSSGGNIKDKEIINLKNSFLSYLKLEEDSLSEAENKIDKSVKANENKLSIKIKLNKEIWGPTSHLLIGLNKSEVWEQHRAVEIEPDNLKEEALRDLIKESYRLWEDPTLCKYFESDEKGSILEKVGQEVKVFLTLLTNEGLLPILSQEYIETWDTDWKELIIERLTSLALDTNKEVSGIVNNLLDYIPIIVPKEHPAQEIVEAVLNEINPSSSSIALSQRA